MRSFVPQTTAAQTSSSYRWTILALATLAQTGASLLAQGVPTLAVFYQAEYGLSRAQVGLFAAIMNVGGLCAIALAGRAVDRFGEGRVIGLGGILLGLTVMLLAVAPDWRVAAAILWLAGVWQSSTTPAGGKAIMSWFPHRDRGLAMGIRQTGIPLGGMLAALFLTRLALAWNWRSAVAAGGVLCAALAGLAWWTYREPPEPPAPAPGGGGRSHSRASDAASPAAKVRPASFRELLIHPGMVAASMAGLILVWGQWGILTYLVLYLTERLGYPVPVAATCLAAAQIGGALGRVVWGHVSDRVFAGRRRPVLMLLSWLAGGLIAAQALLHRGLPGFVVVAAAAAAGLCVIGWNGLHITLVTELAGPDRAGTGLGISLTWIQIGIISGPPMFGWLVDVTGSYQLAWVALGAALALASLLFAQVRERAGTAAPAAASARG